MRLFQLTGFFAAVFGLTLGYFLASPVEPDTPLVIWAFEFWLLLLAAVALALSAFTLLPSSVALLWPSVRHRARFTGKLWLCIWGVNGILAMGYVVIAVAWGFSLINSSVGN